MWERDSSEMQSLSSSIVIIIASELVSTATRGRCGSVASIASTAARRGMSFCGTTQS